MVTTTYLEMLVPPAYPPPQFPEGVQILRCLRPSVAYYRFLYIQVGRLWAWNDRDKISDEELFEILNRPGVELYVLFYEGHPAGFSELKVSPQETQVQYFGLLPDYIGRGLGRRFLEWTVHTAWRSGLQRLWVHTCTQDHTNALATYTKAGFVPYKEEVK